MISASVSGRNRTWVFTIHGMTSDEVQTAINEAEGTIEVMAKFVPHTPSDVNDVDTGDGAVIVVEDEDDKSAWIADVTDVEVQQVPKWIMVEIEVR